MKIINYSNNITKKSYVNKQRIRILNLVINENPTNKINFKIRVR
jgi:hypothetical protein